VWEFVVWMVGQVDLPLTKYSKKFENLPAGKAGRRVVFCSFNVRDPPAEPVIFSKESVLITSCSELSAC